MVGDNTNQRGNWLSVLKGSAEWLGFRNANKIDNKLMGGEKRKHHHVFKSDILNDVVHKPAGDADPYLWSFREFLAIEVRHKTK